MESKAAILFKSHDSRFAEYHNSLYQELENINRFYLKNIENVDVYYLKANPNLEQDIFYDIETKIIWIRSEENYYGSLKNKVLSSLRYLINEADKEYKYYFVTNLSTIVNVQSLLKEMVKATSVNCLAFVGSYIWKGSSYYFPSGAGVIYEKGFLETLLKHEEKIDHNIYPESDDVFFGLLIKEKGLNITPLKRIDLLKDTCNFTSEIFEVSHIRVKFSNNRDAESIVHKKIYEAIYNKDLKR
jgi:hypothetical protein